MTIPAGIAADEVPGAGDALAGEAATAHIMGTARMGNDPRTSVTDAYGRLHDVENVYVADGSVFVSSGGFNPTLTIMALSLRMARHVAGVSAARESRPQGALPRTGGSIPLAATAGAFSAAGLAAAYERSHRCRSKPIATEPLPPSS